MVEFYARVTNNSIRGSEMQCWMVLLEWQFDLSFYDTSFSVTVVLFMLELSPH